MAETKTKNITTTSWTQQLSPGTLAEEKAHLKKYLTLSSWQYLVILGIAISGLAAFVNTYNAWSNINSNLQACAQNDTLQKELNTQFIVILVISCLAVVLGVILAWILRHNQRKLLTWGITTAGLFGILYALSIKFQSATNNTKLAVSWIAFIGFIILGFFVSTGTKITGLSSLSPKIESESWGVED